MAKRGRPKGSKNAPKPGYALPNSAPGAPHPGRHQGPLILCQRCYTCAPAATFWKHAQACYKLVNCPVCKGPFPCNNASCAWYGHVDSLHVPTEFLNAFRLVIGQRLARYDLLAQLNPEALKWALAACGVDSPERMMRKILIVKNALDCEDHVEHSKLFKQYGG